MNQRIQSFYNNYKKIVTKVVNSNYYAFFNIIVLILSAISLSNGNKEESFSFLGYVFFNLDNAYSIFFIIDFFLNFSIKPIKETFTTFWGLFDVCVLIISIASLKGLLNFTSLRLWLIIKYLDKVPGLEYTNSICSALKKSMNIIKDIGIFALFFFTCTGILAVSFWGGKMTNYCIDDNGKYYDTNRLCSTNSKFGFQCPFNYTCTKVKEPPEPTTISFDSFFISWLNIFQVLTTEGWSEIYFRVADVSSRFSFFFFVFIIVCGNWLLLQLIVATVVQSLKSQIKIKKKYNITKSKTFVIDEKNTHHLTLKKKLEKFINNSWVENGILIITIIDVIFISMMNSNISGKFSKFIFIVEIICTSVFTLEMVIKIYVLGFLGYWKSSIYNIMDGTFTILSILEIILNSDSGIAVFRILRAFRILRLTKFLPQLSNLISVFCDSAKPLFSLFVIWLLSVIIFSLFTIQFFEGGMNLFNNKPKNNLENFYYSFLSVVQLYTVENWDSIKNNVYESKGIVGTLIPIIIIIVGAYIFSQFLVAILLNSFIDRLQADNFYKKINDNKGNTKHIIKYVIGELFEPYTKKERSKSKDKDKDKSKNERKSIFKNNSNSKINTEDITELENYTEPSSEKILHKNSLEILRIAHKNVNENVNENENNKPKNRINSEKMEESIPKSFSFPIELNQSQGVNKRPKNLLIPNSQNTITDDHLSNFEILSRISNQKRNENLYKNSNNDHHQENNNNNNNNINNNKNNDDDLIMTMPMPMRMFDIMHDEPASATEPSQGTPSSELDTPNPFDYSELNNNNNNSNIPLNKVLMNNNKYTIKISDAKNIGHLTGGGKTNVPHVFSKIIKESKKASDERKKNVREEIEQIENERSPTLTPSSPNILKRLIKNKKNRHIVSDSNLQVHEREDLKDYFSVKTDNPMIHSSTSINQEEKVVVESLDITNIDIGELPINLTIPNDQNQNDYLSSKTESTHISSFQRCQRKIKHVKIKTSTVLFSKTRKLHKLYRDSYFVHICYKTIKNDLYFYFVALVTVASCISLALEEPNPRDSQYYETLFKFDIFYTVVFIIDLLLNIIAYGSLFTKRAYLKKLYNWIDVAVVLISLLNVLGYGDTFHSLRVFRLVRILKFFKIHDGLRIVSTSVWKTIPSLVVALIPYLFYILICSSVSLSLFVNKGWECNDPLIKDKNHCVGNFTNVINNVNVTEPRVWKPYPVTYDNFFDSMLSSFIVSHQEAWPDIMYRYMNKEDYTTMNGHQLHLGYSIFFILSVLIGNWLFLAVVTALIFNNLKRNQDILRGIQYLSDGQRKLLDYIKLIITNKPNFPMERSRSSLRNKVRKIITSKLFNRISFTVIGLNVIVMMLDCTNNSELLTKIINYSEIVFIILYTIEVIILLYGYGIKYFFKDYWNILSFAIVVTSILSLFLNSSTSPIIFSSIRLLRVLRIIKYAKGLKALGIAIFFNFTQLFNVLFLMFIICFVFAIIGYHYFGNINIKYTSFLNSNLNFSSFINSFISVFIFCTGEGWPFALADCSGKSIRNTCNPEIENCGTKWAVIYFIALQVIFNWILLNSFIAITVDTFVTVLEEHDEIVRLEKVWNAFNQQWIKYDWNKSGDLTFVELVNMYNSFKLPKGTEWGNQNRSNGLLLVKPPMEELFKSVKVYKNRCKYHDVIFGFLNSWMGEELPESFLVREKKKVKTGYEKKIFEKRKNSIYSFDNSIEEDENFFNKTKKAYNEMAKRLSLRSSIRRESTDVNIHILVEDLDKFENGKDDDDTLNSSTTNSPTSNFEDEYEYIKMNMKTCNGRLQNTYTANLIKSLKDEDDLETKNSNTTTSVPATPPTTTTTTSTIFNLFDSNKHDFSSETLNELNHSLEDVKEEENEEEEEEKSNNNNNNNNENENENKDKKENNKSNVNIKIKDSPNQDKDKNKEKEKEKDKKRIKRLSNGYRYPRDSNYYNNKRHSTLVNSNNININYINTNNNHIYNEPISTSSINLNPRSSLTIPKTSNLMINTSMVPIANQIMDEPISIDNNDSIIKPLQSKSNSNKLMVPNRLSSYPKYKYVEPRLNINTSIITNEEKNSIPNYPFPKDSNNNNNNNNIDNNNNNSNHSSSSSNNNNNHKNHIRNNSRKSSSHINYSSKSNNSNTNINDSNNNSSSTRTKTDSVNYANLRNLKNNRHKTFSSFKTSEKLSLNALGRSKSYDSNLNIYNTSNTSPISDIHRSIIELDEIIGIDDEEEEKKNKHKSIHLKTNLHRIKSRTSFRMGFKDNYLSNDILIDVNNQGLPFHVVYSIWKIQQKFKNSKNQKKKENNNTNNNDVNNNDVNNNNNNNNNN